MLEFKKRQWVSNLEENRSIRKADETKNETCKGNLQGKVFDWYLRDKRTVRRNFGRHIVQVSGKIRRICQEAFYGCSHLKTDERHHNTCQMSDEECIRRFLEWALCDVGCLELVREWIVWVEPRGGYRGGWIGWISTPHFSVKKIIRNVTLFEIENK